MPWLHVCAVAIAGTVHAGGLLDYGAVKEGLMSGKIGGLGLDVHFWEPTDPEDFIAQHPK